MRVRLTTIWDSLNNSFLFVPGLILLLLLGCAIALPLASLTWSDWIEGNLQWMLLTPGTAQAILSTVAGTMVTILSVVFSITLVALSIATSQLGPRLMRTFTSNLITQITMGLLIGTSIYCLLVLGTVRDQDEAEFVPHLAVSFGTLLAFVSLIALIYFIHSIVILIQAPHLVQRVGQDLDAAVARLYPDPMEEGDDERTIRERLEATREELGPPDGAVLADKDGYVQGVEVERLVQLGARHDLVLELLKGPGQFVTWQTPIAKVWGQHNEDLELDRVVNEMYLLGNRPTPRQDVESCVNELVEVASRALSPGINDPFTAINCIDRLTASLSRLARRKITSPFHDDSEGNVRVILPKLPFPHVLDRSFDQIRQYGRTHVSVMIRILEALTTIAQQAAREEDLKAIELQGRIVADMARESWGEGHDLDTLRRYYSYLREVLRVQHAEKEQYGVPLTPEEQIVAESKGDQENPTRREREAG